MQTIADFKRRLAPGVKIHTIYHQKILGRDAKGLVFGDEDKGIRTVNRVLSTQFTLNTMRNGNMIESWMQFPKAKEVKFLDEDTIQIYTEHEGSLIPCLTYKFVNEYGHCRNCGCYCNLEELTDEGFCGSECYDDFFYPDED
jgi:hypothetical protein